VTSLQLLGIAAPSTTRIRGRLAIRVALTNHRTRTDDLATLAAEVSRLGKDALCGKAVTKIKRPEGTRNPKSTVTIQPVNALMNICWQPRICLL